jgi:hypothetical protein
VTNNLTREGVGGTFVHEVGKSLQVYMELLVIGLRIVLVIQSLQCVSTKQF